MNVKLRVLSMGALFFAAHNLSAQTDSTKVQEIDEVVVVAYGTQKKSTLTGANVQIGAKEIEDRPLSNALQALDGAGAGIQIAAGSGQPGEHQFNLALERRGQYRTQRGHQSHHRRGGDGRAAQWQSDDPGPAGNAGQFRAARIGRLGNDPAGGYRAR